jgi:immune inhibitor A
MLSLCAVSVLAISAGISAAASPAPPERDAAPAGGHNLQSPMSEKQAALRERAVELKLRGQAKADAKVVEVAKGQYVELAREATDRVFVVIAEFDENRRHPSYCDLGQSCAFPPDGSAATYVGPLHNSIPEPDRSNDNTTLWQSDFSRAHYENMYFNRMAAYWQSQSSGRYSVEGSVTEWVRVPFNEARYGRDFCGGIVCSNTWWLISHAMAIWVQDRLSSGMTHQQVTDYLKTFDHWDRYDHDGDGNFDEPDGYIDHFQIVHAGGDQAAGDPSQGSDAIWSHRWYVQLNPIGATGPTVAGNIVPFGGIDAGAAATAAGTGAPGVALPNNPTGVWVGDYTIQPENGGLGVFVHEYGHDLGLPDLYDTSGNTGGAENSTGFWTLMSSGANIGDGGPNGIGDQPTDLGAWEKFQLGWLGCGACPGGRFYEVAFAGQRSEHKLGPANTATKQAQALFVVLPDKHVTVDLGAPFAGSKYYYSGQGDDLDHRMYRSFTLPAGASLSAKVRYDIELDWDYAYAVVSTDGGATWTNLDTSVSSHTNPNGQNFGNGITGSSGGNWVDLTASLSGYTGNVLLGFRYWTDGAVVNPGFQVDEISVTGSAVDGAETDTGWTFAPAGGFRTTTGQEQSSHFNAYVAEYRGYRGYDRSLATAYNLGFLDSRPDWVEHFPYQDGLLVSYWDSSRSDNNVGDHPGSGLILPVDAHPSLHAYQDGTLVRPRILSYDSTFGLEPTDAITINRNSQPIVIPSQPAAPVFDDTKDYWVGGSFPGRYQPGWASVAVPKTGTAIRVKSTSAQQNFMQVQVLPSSDLPGSGKKR